MRRSVFLSSDESGSLRLLGQRIRRARLRRNLSQADLAERVGVTRKVIVALEAGAEKSGLAVVMKVLSVFGYPERLPDLLESDPVGDDLEEVSGRQRAGRRGDGVEDF